MKPSRGRQSLKDTLRDNAASERLYAAMRGIPVRGDLPIPVEPENLRTPRLKPNARPEGDAQDAVIDWLLANPRIHGLKRLNKGVAVEGSRRIAYSHVYGKFDGEYMTALDLEFWLGNVMWGRHHIPCEVEMKAPGFTKPNLNDRTQRMQWARIQYVRAHGGISGFCTSVAEVKQLLEES